MRTAPKGAVFCNQAKTLAAYAAATKKAGVRAEHLTRAAARAVRLAWDRGGGAALAQLPWPTDTGPDVAEAVLEALERGEPGDEASGRIDEINRAATVAWAHGETVRNNRRLAGRLLENYLFRRAAVGEETAARDLSVLVAEATADAVAYGAYAAWGPVESRPWRASLAWTRAADVLYALGDHEKTSASAKETAAEAQVLEVVRAELCKPPPAPSSASELSAAMRRLGIGSES